MVTDTQENRLVGRKNVSCGRWNMKLFIRPFLYTVYGPSSELFLKIENNRTRQPVAVWNDPHQSPLTTQPFHNFVTNVSDSFLVEEKKQPSHLFNSRIILFHPADKRIDRSIEDWIAIHLCTILISALPYIEDNTWQSGWDSCRFGCNLWEKDIENKTTNFHSRVLERVTWDWLSIVHQIIFSSHSWVTSLERRY